MKEEKLLIISHLNKKNWVNSMADFAKKFLVYQKNFLNIMDQIEKQKQFKEK